MNSFKQGIEYWEWDEEVCQQSEMVRFSALQKSISFSLIITCVGNEP